MKMNFTAKNIAFASVIAALYIALIIVFQPMSFGHIQIRVAESLALTPALMPAAIPGIFIGCLVSNILFGGGIIDIIFGSLASLLAAYLTYKLRKNLYLAALPPVIVNAVVVGTYLALLSNISVLLCIFYVGAGQVVSCYCIGIPLVMTLKKYIFKNTL